MLEGYGDLPAGNADTIARDANRSLQRRLAIVVEHHTGDAATAAAIDDVDARDLPDEDQRSRGDVALTEAREEGRHLVLTELDAGEGVAALRIGGRRADHLDTVAATLLEEVHGDIRD